jgi:hypothetical protein
MDCALRQYSIFTFTVRGKYASYYRHFMPVVQQNAHDAKSEPPDAPAADGSLLLSKQHKALLINYFV